jgi:ribonuclease HI
MVRGVAGAVYKGFATIEEARAFIQENRRQETPREKKTSPKPGAPRSRKRTQTSDPPRPPPRAGQIVMYTDGGALGNPGPGGYGVVIDDGGKRRELSGGYRRTTNNRMELMACIAGLSRMPGHRRAIFLQRLPIRHQRHHQRLGQGLEVPGLEKINGEPAANPDLWDRLLALCDLHAVEFRWVKGHTGIEGNERCDQLAKQAASAQNLSIDRLYEDQQ